MLSAQLEARRTHGFARTARAIALGAAAPGDFRVAPAAPLVPLPGVRTAPDPNQRALFPGTLKLALALAGLVWGLRRTETRRFTAFLLALAAGAAGLSLLPGLEGPLAPHAWLRDRIPGLAQLRSFWRAAVLMQVATVLLAAEGIEAVARAARRASSPAEALRGRRRDALRRSHRRAVPPPRPVPAPHRVPGNRARLDPTALPLGPACFTAGSASGPSRTTRDCAPICARPAHGRPG